MERTSFSRVVFRDKGRGDNKELVFFKRWWCVLFAYFQHTNTGYFQLLMETPRERERRRREHLRRGVSILCSTCGIVQLHSIVAPPSTTTGVGLSNINHHLADFKAEEEEEEAKSAFLSRRSATKASTSFCKLCSFWTNHSAVNAPATANPAWSCGSVGSSVGVRSRRRNVSSGEREEASKTKQKSYGTTSFISPTKTM